jgi:hypothetical protein
MRLSNSYLKPVDIVPALNVKGGFQQNWQSLMAMLIQF